MACSCLIVSGCGLFGGNDGSGLSKDLVTASSHSWFPVDTSSAHASTNCNDCHGAYDTFAQFTCIDCHAHEETATTAAHSGVSGFSYDSPSCYRCHPDGTAAGVDHQPIFQIGSTSKHSAAVCADCHVDPANRANVSCTGSACHPQTASNSSHSAVLTGSGGYVWATPDCLSCHPIPSVFRVSSHNNCVTHRGARCRTCHRVNTLAGKPFPATDFNQYACTGSGCHGSNQGTSCNDD